MTVNPTTVQEIYTLMGTKFGREPTKGEVGFAWMEALSRQVSLGTVSIDVAADIALRAGDTIQSFVRGMVNVEQDAATEQALHG